jgi:hypothetical protein
MTAVGDLLDRSHALVPPLAPPAFATASATDRLRAGDRIVAEAAAPAVLEA